MEELRMIESLIKFQRKLGQHPAGFRIRETPCPAVWLEERRKLRMQVEYSVLASSAAGHRGVTEQIELRNQPDSKLFSQRDKPSERLKWNAFLLPAELRMRTERKHAP